jgi:hypothetical protein
MIPELLGGAAKEGVQDANGAETHVGVYIDLQPQDLCPPSAPSISNSQTLDQCHMSTGKTVIFIMVSIPRILP